jgi:hypothetical protein
MADKKIQMTQRNATNDGWDNLYPKTTGDQVVASDGTTFESHLAETATGAHKAKNILVEDTGNHFAGSDLETVLNELFQYANDGKTSIASVIGSPATSGDTFSQLASHIQTAKNTMATNLTAKGTPASGTDTLINLANLIANVNTGKKWASGNFVYTSGSDITINNLNFTPSLVFVSFSDTNNVFYITISSTKTIKYYGSTYYAIGRVYTGVSETAFASTTPLIVTNGFTIPASSAYLSQQLNKNFTWIAYE